MACFQGRHEVVSLLVERRANIEHRAKVRECTWNTFVCSQFVNPYEIHLNNQYFCNAMLITMFTVRVCACFQTGLTPLMEAASGGYVDVGRVLLNKGADVNAPPVPSSRDTALTIAADKGHYRFVELLLSRSVTGVGGVGGEGGCNPTVLRVAYPILLAVKLIFYKASPQI